MSGLVVGKEDDEKMLTLRLNELSVDYAGSTMNRGRRRRRTTTITTTTTTVPKKIITARSYQNSNLDGCKRTNRKRRQGWESMYISSFAGTGGFASEDEEGNDEESKRETWFVIC